MTDNNQVKVVHLCLSCVVLPFLDLVGHLWVRLVEYMVGDLHKITLHLTFDRLNAFAFLLNNPLLGLELLLFLLKLVLLLRLDVFFALALRKILIGDMSS